MWIKNIWFNSRIENFVELDSMTHRHWRMGQKMWMNITMSCIFCRCCFSWIKWKCDCSLLIQHNCVMKTEIEKESKNVGWKVISIRCTCIFVINDNLIILYSFLCFHFHVFVSYAWWLVCRHRLCNSSQLQSSECERGLIWYTIYIYLSMLANVM